MARVARGRDSEPSGGAINARSVQGASTVGACTRGSKIGITAEEVKKITGSGFKPLPRRWVVERTWGVAGQSPTPANLTTNETQPSPRDSSGPPTHTPSYAASHNHPKTQPPTQNNQTASEGAR